MTSLDPDYLGLYLVLDPDHCRGIVMETAQAAIDGGVSCIQLRWKTGTDREVVELARAIHALTARHTIPLIINDRTDIALTVGAEGVHLGVDDLPVVDARGIVGLDFIIGYSPETDRQIQEAAAAGASYLGVGPIFGTATKLDAGAALGEDEFRRRRSLTDLPVVAIGGIAGHNAARAIAAGADGVAVASAILGAADPAMATSSLRHAVQRST